MATNIAEAVRQYLISKNTRLGSRIYTNTVRQGVELPFCRLEWVYGGSEEHLRGTAGVGSGTLTIEVYAATPETAHEISETIRLSQVKQTGDLNRFHRFRGDLNGVDVLTTSSTDGYEQDIDPPVEGGKDARWYFSRDYSFIYREPAV